MFGNSAIIQVPFKVYTLYIYIHICIYSVCKTIMMTTIYKLTVCIVGDTSYPAFGHKKHF